MRKLLLTRNQRSISLIVIHCAYIEFQAMSFFRPIAQTLFKADVGLFSLVRQKF